MQNTRETAIRKWRKEAGLSLEEACDRFEQQGFKRPSTAKLSRIENGQDVPPDMVAEFQAVTGLMPSEISPKLAKIFAAETGAA